MDEQERGRDLLRLANALSALYPKDNDERCWCWEGKAAQTRLVGVQRWEPKKQKEEKERKTQSSRWRPRPRRQKPKAAPVVSDQAPAEQTPSEITPSETTASGLPKIGIPDVDD